MKKSSMIGINKCLRVFIKLVRKKVIKFDLEN